MATSKATSRPIRQCKSHMAHGRHPPSEGVGHGEVGWVETMSSGKTASGSVSAAGIHSRMAGHDRSIGSKVSMSNGGSGGMLTSASQSPWSRSQVSEQVTALAEESAKDFQDGEDELTMGDGQADVGGDPTGGLEGTALMAGEAGEAGGKVAAATEGLNGGNHHPWRGLNVA